MKVFVDTNVFIDYICKRDQFLVPAKGVIAACLPASLVLEALNSDWKDYEDSLQYATAMQRESNCIVTRNKKDFEKAQIPVYTPDEFLATLVVKE